MTGKINLLINLVLHNYHILLLVLSFLMTNGQPSLTSEKCTRPCTQTHSSINTYCIEISIYTQRYKYISIYMYTYIEIYLNATVNPEGCHVSSMVLNRYWVSGNIIFMIKVHPCRHLVGIIKQTINDSLTRQVCPMSTRVCIYLISLVL